MDRLNRSRRAGFTAVEIFAVAGVMALLLAMGFLGYRSTRLMARVTLAESNLKQISTGMELYFRRFGSYPPQGSDLTVVLAPFVQSPKVFENPLLEESTPGETINQLYQQPSLAEVDSPDHYVTALIADNGRTVVVLKTGDKVVRRDDLTFNPEGSSDDLLALLDPQPGGSSGDDDPPAEEPAPEPMVPDEPDDGSGSPDDYTEEPTEGLIRNNACRDATFQVIATNLTSGGTDVPVLVYGKFGKAVTYVVVQDGVNRVKFEDAGDGGLGEDGEEETDRFVMKVKGTSEGVTVTTKAGTSTATTSFTGVDGQPPAPGSSQTDSLGFQITIESVEATTDPATGTTSYTYTVSVSSVDADHALSHVEFDFGEDAEVTVEECPTTRYSGEPMFGGQNVNGGETEVRTLKAGDSFALIGHAIYSSCCVTYASDIDIAQVRTLRHGDQVDHNQIAPFLVEQGLVDNMGIVTILDNQVLFLFELGVTDPSYFDLDDLVILVTLTDAANPAECE